MAIIRSVQVAVLVVACTAGPAWRPTAPPSITGTITNISGDRILVEENPAETAGSEKASVRLTERTRIFSAAGDPAVRGDLRVGRRVSVWFIGPVAESYPVQATASTIRLD